jgi:hypothetical protein
MRRRRSPLFRFPGPTSSTGGRRRLRRISMRSFFIDRPPPCQNPHQKTMAAPFGRWAAKVPFIRPALSKRLLLRSTVSAASPESPPLRLTILDPDSKHQDGLEFQSARALRLWVKSQRGTLSVIRPGQIPLVLDPTHYDRLDPDAVYLISATFPQQGILAVKHNRVSDKAWENRCRLKLNDWFEEQRNIRSRNGETCA